jgi:hypothetical protein
MNLERKNSKKILEELTFYFPLIRHGPYRKRRLQKFFIASGTSFRSCYLATIRGYTDRPTDTPATIPVLLTVFFAAGTCLPSRCVAIEVYTLPSLCLATTYRHTNWLEGFVKYAVEMGSGNMHRWKNWEMMFSMKSVCQLHDLTIELLVEVFSVRSVSICYKQEKSRI